MRSKYFNFVIERYREYLLSVIRMILIPPQRYCILSTFWKYHLIFEVELIGLICILVFWIKYILVMYLWSLNNDNVVSVPTAGCWNATNNPIWLRDVSSFWMACIWAWESLDEVGQMRFVIKLAHVNIFQTTLSRANPWRISLTHFKNIS